MLLKQLGISHHVFLNTYEYVYKLVNSRYQYLILNENFEITLFSIILNIILLIANDNLIKLLNIHSKMY